MIHDIEAEADRYEDILAEIELFMEKIPRCPVCSSDDTYLVSLHTRTCHDCGHRFGENTVQKNAA